VKGIRNRARHFGYLVHDIVTITNIGYLISHICYENRCQLRDLDEKKR